ncbi:hypothetical protein [Phytomonospora endophytica]|uniref:Uncharacterized protein n=1 Tax=Phytomonospora endophytica TaxID=714109 RepID=A0A841FLV5_9ACTN|nr:hypothetical protein [Phytomonospora endophytica]MBB6034167.1 hypothetical protein [Phytomonospora endophytica]GIG66559.1 hypothetical protein Pen01_28540 [Phytomonospora endophytica]
MNVSPDPRPRPAVLALLTLWRMGVAACGLTGVYLVVSEVDDFYYLSQLGSLAVGVVYIGLALVPVFTMGRRHEPGSSWLRGSLAVVMSLIAVTSILLLDPALDQTGFLLEHLVTPLVVVADFVLVGRGQFRTRPWEPLTWVALPLVYFAFLLATGVQAYQSIFDPDSPEFVPIVLGFFGALIVCGYVLFGLARLVGAIRAPAPAGPVASTPW